VLSEEATNANFVIFVLTRPVLKPTIYDTRGEHANHYTTDVVSGSWSVYSGYQTLGYTRRNIARLSMYDVLRIFGVYKQMYKYL